VYEFHGSFEGGMGGKQFLGCGSQMKDYSSEIRPQYKYITSRGTSFFKISNQYFAYHGTL